MKPIQQVFKLKGSREYVHGTDIFDQLVAHLDPNRNSIADLEITFSKRIANTACIWYFTAAGNNPEPLSAPCRGRFQLNGTEYSFALAPQIEQGIRHRVTYDEDEITKGSRTTDSTALVPAKASYTFIETLVSLTKKFHNCYYRPKANQWMFGRIELVVVPDSVARIGIRLEKIVPNRLSKCSILTDGDEIGVIFFTVG